MHQCAQMYHDRWNCDAQACLPRLMSPLVKQILAGCVCAVTAAIVSHPLETLLTQKRIHSPAVYRNVFSSFHPVHQRYSKFIHGQPSICYVRTIFLVSTYRTVSSCRQRSQRTIHRSCPWTNLHISSTYTCLRFSPQDLWQIDF